MTDSRSPESRSCATDYSTVVPLNTILNPSCMITYLCSGRSGFLVIGIIDITSRLLVFSSSII